MAYHIHDCLSVMLQVLTLSSAFCTAAPWCCWASAVAFVASVNFALSFFKASFACCNSCPSRLVSDCSSFTCWCSAWTASVCADCAFDNSAFMLATLVVSSIFLVFIIVSWFCSCRIFCASCSPEAAAFVFSCWRWAYKTIMTKQMLSSNEVDAH